MAGPIEVEVNGDLERAFKNLKKKMAFEGVFKELKRRRYYEKPSAQKKRKQEEAERRRVKKMRRMMVHSPLKKVPGPGARPFSRDQQSVPDDQDKMAPQKSYAAKSE
jgi:small subunit ribosomal protein S21